MGMKYVRRGEVSRAFGVCAGRMRGVLSVRSLSEGGRRLLIMPYRPRGVCRTNDIRCLIGTKYVRRGDVSRAFCADAGRMRGALSGWSLSAADGGCSLCRIARAESAEPMASIAGEGTKMREAAV